jgi:hypothetical protein
MRIRELDGIHETIEVPWICALQRCPKETTPDFTRRCCPCWRLLPGEEVPEIGRGLHGAIYDVTDHGGLGIQYETVLFCKALCHSRSVLIGNIQLNKVCAVTLKKEPDLVKTGGSLGKANEGQDIHHKGMFSYIFRQ